MLFSSLLVSFSQLLLKLSAREHRHGGVVAYLNTRVLVAYVLFFVTMLLNVFAYRTLELKIGSILVASSYVFTMLISLFYLKEPIGWRGSLGNILVFLGIVIFFAGI